MRQLADRRAGKLVPVREGIPNSGQLPVGSGQANIQEVARIQKRGGQLTCELRILQGALEVMRHEQARFKSSSRAGNYYLPIARGMIWKLLADKTATAVSK